MKNAVAYIRVSTNSDDQLASLPNQREVLERFCRAKDYNLIEVYADEGISARSAKKRKAFQRLMQDSSKGRFEVVVLKDISRFSRNVRVTLNSVFELRENNVALHFLDEEKEMSHDDAFILTVKAGVAEQESRNTSKRVRATKKNNAQNGRVPTRIYGYDRVDNFTLRINETEAEVVRELFHKYTVEGWGCRKLVLWLRNSLIPSKGYSNSKKQGSPDYWNSKTVRRMLENPLYKGVLQTYKSTSDYDLNKKIDVPKDNWFTHDRPEWAIVDSKTWDKAQEIIISRREIYQNEKPAGRYSNAHLYSNLVYCECCGKSYGYKHYKYKNERRYYRCITNNNYGATTCANAVTVDEDELSAYIMNYFKSLLAGGRQAYMDKIISDFLKKHNPDTTAVQEKKLMKTIKDVAAQKEKLKAMYMRNIIDIDELEQKTKEIDFSMSDIERQLFNLQRIKEKQTSMRGVIDSILDRVEELVNTNMLSNALLREVVDKITVSLDGVVSIYPKGLDL